MESKARNSSKLRSLLMFRTAKPAALAPQPNNTKAMTPNHHQTSLTPPNMGCTFMILNRDEQAPPQVTLFVAPPPPNSKGKLHDLYEDEEVDAKAAHYINRVREKFRSG